MGGWGPTEDWLRIPKASTEFEPAIHTACVYRSV